MAQWTADRWAENGFTSRLDEYCKLALRPWHKSLINNQCACYSPKFDLTPLDVYLNYPVSHSLTLTYANGSTSKASLEEAVLAEDDSKWMSRLKVTVQF